jgi:hypothetical protein
MFTKTILKHEHVIIGIACIMGAYLHSIVSSLIIMDSSERFKRNCIHIPHGFAGGLISNFEIKYGIIYFSLIIIYQILEEIENIRKYNEDHSWYDIEGYAIGFTSCVYYLYLMKNIKHKYELTNSENNI